MNLSYRMQVFQPGAIMFHTDAYEYWINLNAAFTFSSSDTSFIASSHDIIEIPVDTEIHAESKDGITLEVITLSDFNIINNAVRHYTGPYMHMIVDQCLQAYALQGIQLPRKRELQEDMNRLVLDYLLSLGLLNTETPAGVADVIEAIQEHFADADFDLTAAIQKVGYSESHFRVLFRKQTSMTPKEFLIRRRIEAAQDLIRHNEQTPIAEIAFQCGFRDVFYFSKKFKQLIGVAPSEYREHTKKV